MRQPRKRFPFESWALLYPPPPFEGQPASPVVLETAPVKQRGFALAAWIVIIVLVSATVVIQNIRPSLEQKVEKKLPKDKKDKIPAEDEISSAINKMQARYLIGGNAILEQGGEQFLDQLNMFKFGTPHEQLEFAIFAGELVNARRALQALEHTEQRWQLYKKPPGEETFQLLHILERLYEDYADLRFDAPSVKNSERLLLKEKLGWAGQLALVPEKVQLPKHLDAAAGAPLDLSVAKLKSSPDAKERAEVLQPAKRTFFTAIGGAGVWCCLGVPSGLIGLFILVGLVWTNRLHGQLHIERGNHGIYAETFALWMLLFILLGIVPRIVFPDAPGLLLSVVAFFMSLLALLWPVLRGIPWKTVREEIGWTAKNPGMEALWGVAWYVMSLPIMMIGLVLTVILMLIYATLQAPTETGGNGGPIAPPGREAAHPIVGEIANANWPTLLVIFLLASVAAPIIEETMFRGVLYRHLREATGKWGGILSVLISGLIVSFVFAIIHPQGVLAAPVLMSLAFGFTLARESRGSLIPCMVAHGVSNGLVLTAAVLMMSG